MYGDQKTKADRQKFIKPIHDKSVKARALERKKNVDVKRKYPNTEKGKKPYLNPNYKEENVDKRKE